MMTNEFYSIVTDYGIEKQTNCLNNGIAFDLYQIALGDGNGTYYEPVSSQTQLRHEVWRGTISTCEWENNKFYCIVNVPANDGGFYIREAGVFDNSNNMIAITKFPETYKQTPDSGTVKQLTIKIEVHFANNQIAQLVVNPNITTATREELETLQNNIQSNFQLFSEKGQINGYAPLDETGKVPKVHIPEIDQKSLLTPFCINCAKIDSNGNPNIFETVIGVPSSTTVSGTPEINYNFSTGNPGTYSINIPVNGYYSIAVIGGGGSGGSHINMYNVIAYYSGGSGAGFVGQIYLSAGMHTIQVGNAGSASSIDDLIIADSGTNGAMNNMISGTAGSGGILSVSSSASIRNVSIQQNGNNGYATLGSNVSGGNSVYCGYGNGGASNSSPTSGFVQVSLHIDSTISETTVAGIPGGTFLSFKVNEYEPLIATLANRKSFKLNHLNTINLNQYTTNGDYTVYINEYGDIQLLLGALYVQKVARNNLSTDDIWLNISVEPSLAYKYNGTDFAVWNYVPVGIITITNSQIMAVTTFLFNINRYKDILPLPLGKPSANFYTYPLPASGGSITAAYNGWINFTTLGSTSLQLYNVTRGNIMNAEYSSNAQAQAVSVACSKDDVIQLYYSGLTNQRWLRCYSDIGG